MAHHRARARWSPASSTTSFFADLTIPPIRRPAAMAAKWPPWGCDPCDRRRRQRVESSTSSAPICFAFARPFRCPPRRASSPFPGHLEGHHRQGGRVPGRPAAGHGTPPARVAGCGGGFLGTSELTSRGRLGRAAPRPRAATWRRPAGTYGSGWLGLGRVRRRRDVRSVPPAKLLSLPNLNPGQDIRDDRHTVHTKADTRT